MLHDSVVTVTESYRNVGLVSLRERFLNMDTGDSATGWTFRSQKLHTWTFGLMWLVKSAFCIVYPVMTGGAHRVVRAWHTSAAAVCDSGSVLQ